MKMHQQKAIESSLTKEETDLKVDLVERWSKDPKKEPVQA